MISKHNALAWLAILIVLCGLSTYQIKQHWRIQTDILALFPQDADEPLVQVIRRTLAGEPGRTAFFLVSHAQSQIARHATRQLGQLMDASRFTSHSAINSLVQPSVHICSAMMAINFSLTISPKSCTSHFHLGR